MNIMELNDDQWSFIRPHLPPQPKVGRKRANDRQTINAILYVLITGCRWRDIPKSYGSYVTAIRYCLEKVETMVSRRRMDKYSDRDPK